MARTTQPSNDRPSYRRLLLGLLLLMAFAVPVRVAALWALGRDSLGADPDGYRMLAENLIEHGVYGFVEPDGRHTATAFRPPIYPLTLAALAWGGKVQPLAVAGFHLLCGTLTIVLVWRLGGRWHLGRWSFLAALLVAIDPILLNQSAQLMTETLATLLAVTVLWGLTDLGERPSLGAALLVGITLGMSVLCRPVFAVWTGLLLLSMLRLPAPRQQRLACIATAMAGCLLIVAPWVVRNTWRLGKPVMFTTHGGYTVLLGNNPHFYAYLRGESADPVWDAEELHTGFRRPAPHEPPLSEVDRDQRDYVLARRAIRAEPAMFVRSTLVRIGRLWTPLPHQLTVDETPWRRWMRYAIAAWYSALFCFAAVSAVRFRRRLLSRPWLWTLLLSVAFTLVHAVYWSNMRMRAPVMPAVCLLAAAAFAGTAKRAENHDRHAMDENQE